MRDAKWCPEEKEPTEMLLPSSLPPAEHCDRGRRGRLLNENFSFAAASTLDTFLHFFSLFFKAQARSEEKQTGYKWSLGAQLLLFLRVGQFNRKLIHYLIVRFNSNEFCNQGHVETNHPVSYLEQFNLEPFVPQLAQCFSIQLSGCQALVALRIVM